MANNKDNINFEVVDDNDFFVKPSVIVNPSITPEPVLGPSPGPSTESSPTINTNPNIEVPSKSTPLSISANVAQMQDTTFDQTVRNYIRANNPKLFILTPCFGSVCFVNYVNCLMATMNMFQNLQFPLQIEFCKNDSLVSRARNNLVARAMNDPKTTHILFIDNDITWDPIDILKLVIANKPIVGGVYPLKHYHWDKLVKDEANPYNTNIVHSLITKKNNSQLKNLISNADMVQHNLLRYNINYIDPYLNIENNLAKVKHMATGFMMIHRDTIEKMMKAFPSVKYVDDVGFLQGKENDYAYALFDCGVEEGHYFSEDWLFCHRWTKMGGSIWADVSISLTHTGIEDYKGCYVASII